MSFLLIKSTRQKADQTRNALNNVGIYFEEGIKQNEIIFFAYCRSQDDMNTILMSGIDSSNLEVVQTTNNLPDMSIKVKVPSFLKSPAFSL